MKKILLLLAICVSGVAYGQQSYQIGSITVDSAVFGSYILYCYNNPIIKKGKHFSECWPQGEGVYVGNRSTLMCEERVRKYNDELEKQSLSGEIKNKEYHKERCDTVYRWYFMGEESTQHSKEFEIVTRPAWTELVGTNTYKLPRTPSETDFVVWFIKRQKK